MSSIIYSALQVSADVAASGIRGICIGVSSLIHPSSSGSYPLYLSGLGNATGSNTTAGIARVEIPLEGNWFMTSQNWKSQTGRVT